MRNLIAAAFCLATTPAFALNVCVEGAYPPFSETSADGSLVGFDIDMANALCEQVGETCTLVKVDWDGIIPALLEKKCDAIVASMSSTEERKQVIDFTAKYYQVPNEFVGRADSGIDPAAPGGLDGKVVGAQRGTIHQAYVEKHYPGVQLTLYGSQDEAILDLTSGRIDLIVGDAIQLEEGFVNTPAGEGYARVGEQFFDPEIHGEGAAVGVRKGDTELRDKLSAAILALRESGKYDEIQKKYFKIDIYGS
ncbi:transporter substrate-binding domain-containing protein [Amaricoccus sp.]|uniref:transporter substrate-binding domain-containing protein n=1 Tax=Amaricoccus sp. TaxID=1872485 RepID=UPI001B5AF0CE|nr:transporter substrate-binding domain-containing protein [Amaricoccus sp.]MBP7241625.1 transporter substrate-binding domain-containing protein [Amaricoccus sp.]